MNPLEVTVALPPLAALPIRAKHLEDVALINEFTHESVSTNFLVNLFEHCSDIRSFCAFRLKKDGQQPHQVTIPAPSLQHLKLENSMLLDKNNRLCCPKLSYFDFAKDAQTTILDMNFGECLVECDSLQKMRILLQSSVPPTFWKDFSAPYNLEEVQIYAVMISFIISSFSKHSNCDIRMTL